MVEPQKSTGKNGTVKVAARVDNEPMTYLNGEGEMMGYDIAVCNLICDKLDIKAEYVTASAKSLVKNVMSGKVNFAVGPFSITEERRQNVDFCDVTYSGATLEEKLNTSKIGVMQGTVAVKYIAVRPCSR